MTGRILATLLLGLPLSALAALDSDRSDLCPCAPQAASSTATIADDVIRRIDFVGLRRIPAATLRTHIASREGQRLNPAQVEEDVRALDRLGWFDSVTAEVRLLPLLLADVGVATGPHPGGPWVPETGRWASSPPALGSDDYGLRLVFVIEERPFLASVEFRGSKLLSREHIEALLAEKRIVLRVAAPANRTELWRAARAIEAALADRGHPRAQVRLRLEDVPTAAVRAKFEVSDGPPVSVGRVTFAGNQAFSERKLQRQMKRIAPAAPFAELRRKNIYTRERLEEDLERLEGFYHNHGYPEARLGQPTTEVAEERVRRWFHWTMKPFRVDPWPHRRNALRWHISIPIEEGQFYRLGAIEVQNELAGQAAGQIAEPIVALRNLRRDEPYSQEKLSGAREALASGRTHKRANGSSLQEVDVNSQFDHEARVVRVVFRVHERRPYIVRRIEFVGQRRFSDRYYRRRILLKEGEPLDTSKLELGLAQLARAGFIRPVKKQDIHLRLDEQRRLADLAIRVEEIGRQRVSIVGGHASFGSTVGLVYNVFDLFGGEELITAHLEGGPESLQALAGAAKESVFGTRATLGVSLFRNVVRPNVGALSGRRRLFTSDSAGFVAGSSYPLTPRDTLGVNYQLSRSSTQYHLALPPSLSGLPSNSFRTATSSRSVGLTAAHDGGRERLDASASVSGGRLGGNENLLRSSLEYVRLHPDPFSVNQGRNTWAFRAYVAGVSSYHGSLPLQARLFAGEQLVRGFRSGELAPYALVRTDRPDGGGNFRAEASGADLVSAFNAEYRAPVMPRTEAAAFFDTGSGWLLPGWLGPNRPVLLRGTNGALRSSTGLEMRWVVPVLEQPVRAHYAINPVLSSRAFVLPDGTRFRPPHRRTALGWAFGSLF